MKVSLVSQVYRDYRNGYNAVLQAAGRFARNARSSPEFVDCNTIRDNNKLAEFLEGRARSILQTLGNPSRKHQEAGLQRALADLRRLLKSGPLFGKRVRKWIREKVHVEQFQAAFYNWHSHQIIKRKLCCSARKYALRECTSFGCLSPLLSRIFS